MAAEQIEQLKKLLSPSEIFERDAPGYEEASKPWSTWADPRPPLAIQPTTLETMSKVVKFLYESILDFAVRNTGTGSATAKDVILSVQGFKDFSFDQASEVVTLGSGFSWAEVDVLMEEKAPPYQVPSARCGWVGLTGSALVGGLSWLSHEFGLVSDPQNLLDMQIVLRDGWVMWASEEPELMWALRGGGGNFGVVTALKLRARRYPTKIFTGLRLFPYSALHEISRGASAMAGRPGNPKVAMHILNRGSGMGESPQGAKPGIAVFMYDANGEEHGRSEDGFAWLFRVPDGIEMSVQELSLREINRLFDSFKDWQGNNMFFLSAPLLAELDDETLVRAWKWWEDCINAHEGFDYGSTVLLEFMQEGAMGSSGCRVATAWPHSKRRHVMQLVLGSKPGEEGEARIRNMAMKLFAKAGPQIAGPGKETGEFHAGFLHEWNNLEEVYGENLPKLKQIKQTYDPKNRFNKGVNLTDGKITPGMTV